jgi:peptide/nickel transport system permease protein
VPILPVILWTDALVYLLLAAVGGFAWYVRRNEHLRAPWWRVAQTPAAMSALVVLTLFILTGLLDSLHFRPALPAAAGAQPDSAASRNVAYAVEVKSALDLLLSSIANRPERT